MDPGAYAHMDRVCDQLADHVGDEVHNDILQAVAPPMTGFATGELAASVYATPGNPHRVYIGTDHWMTVEYGASPHLITPHGRYPLQDRARGKFFGFTVHHPGSPEQAPMRRAVHQKRRLPYVGGM
jgi:hypothetical protein